MQAVTADDPGKRHARIPGLGAQVSLGRFFERFISFVVVLNGPALLSRSYKTNEGSTRGSLSYL